MWQNSWATIGVSQAMFERFTLRARRVIFHGRYEATVLGNNSIETHHLLLGLFRADPELAHHCLGSQSTLDTMRKDIETRFAGSHNIPLSADLPLSVECKRALAYAAEESEKTKARQVRAGDVLVGLLREKHQRRIANSAPARAGPAIASWASKGVSGERRQWL